jgi:glycosyltransferase involved in cell wall biosynthesis
MKFVADELCKRGHDILVLTSQYGNRNIREEKSIFRSLHYLKSEGMSGFLRRNVQIQRALLGRLNFVITRKIIKHVRPNVVYSGQLTGISILPMKAIVRQNIPIVHHLGNYYFVELVKDCISEPNVLKRSLRKVIHGFYNIEKFDFKHIITVSEAVKKAYRDAGVSGSKIIVIPRGIYSYRISQSHKRISTRQNNMRLLYVGRISRTKGTHIAIRSVKHVLEDIQTKNVTLDIFGDGDEGYLHELENLIDKLKIKRHIHFKEKIDPVMLFDVYKKYDVLLFPSIWEEPFSGVLLEAMSQGLPVIATDTGGTRELIRTEWNGLLIPKEDPKKMAAAIIKLIENHSLYEQISINGIKEIKEKYTLEKIVDRIESYLNDVIRPS